MLIINTLGIQKTVGCFFLPSIVLFVSSASQQMNAFERIETNRVMAEKYTYTMDNYKSLQCRWNTKKMRRIWKSLSQQKYRQPHSHLCGSKCFFSSHVFVRITHDKRSQNAVLSNSISIHLWIRHSFSFDDQYNSSNKLNNMSVSAYNLTRTIQLFYAWLEMERFLKFFETMKIGKRSL